MEKHALLIIADDLTGALDTGVQFAGKGIDVLVLPDPQAALKKHDPDASVLVINTDTRHSTPEEARTIVKALATKFQNYSFFYKKTDSCLRGNIGAELEALMDAAKSDAHIRIRLPFAPAFPALKRITQNGCQYIDGKLIHQSSMANDPLNPITESFIPAIIAKQSAIPVRLAGRDGAIPKAQNHAEILVFDAETGEDLRNTARLLWERDMLRVSAGCAGFAEALMVTLPLEKNSSKIDSHKGAPEASEKFEKLLRTLDLLQRARRNILIVSGSLHDVSINQIKYAMEKNIPAFALPEEETLQAALISDCSQALSEKGISILGTQASLGLSGINTRSSALDIANTLGHITRKIIGKTGPAHLVVFGGDTTLCIVKALQYTQLWPLKELSPGIVLARAGESKELIITKAGAFGEENLISVVTDYVRINELHE